MLVWLQRAWRWISVGPVFQCGCGQMQRVAWGSLAMEFGLCRDCFLKRDF
jgi:hypothetical protein